MVKPKPKVQRSRYLPPRVYGVGAGETTDEEQAYKHALAQWQNKREKLARKADQHIDFFEKTVCIAFLADQHLGGAGVDIERCFGDVELVARTPSMYAITIGDVVDNFVLKSLSHAYWESQVTIVEEWALARRYMRNLAPKLLASVAGNHDNWTKLLTGIDYFREIVAALPRKNEKEQVLYDSDDMRLLVRVNGVEFPGRIRHQWNGKSIYNPTHGAERANKWDQDFIWAVGGHTHESGVARGFNAGGANGMAVLCGSYKVDDAFARFKGFAKPNRSAGVAIIFDSETRSMTGFDNLTMAARVMESLNGDSIRLRRA